jgi:hypothetical protein
MEIFRKLKGELAALLEEVHCLRGGDNTMMRAAGRLYL